MTNLREKIDLELKNISLVLNELKKVAKKSKKSVAEIAGIGTFLHNFYSGMENIVKLILKSNKIVIPDSPTWHKDLIDVALQLDIITEVTKIDLGKFLTFRHFFIHAYGYMLNEEELKPLIDLAPKVFLKFKDDIQEYL